MLFSVKLLTFGSAYVEMTFFSLFYKRKDWTRGLFRWTTGLTAAICKMSVMPSTEQIIYLSV
jgi:hypothetical protein